MTSEISITKDSELGLWKCDLDSNTRRSQSLGTKKTRVTSSYEYGLLSEIVEEIVEKRSKGVINIALVSKSVSLV